MGTLLVAAAAMLFVLAWGLTGRFGGLGEIELGAGHIPGNQTADSVPLVNRTAGATDGNYDSLDSPRGTDTTAATPDVLEILLLRVAGSAATTTLVQVGYASATTTDAVSLPAGAVTMFSQRLPAVAALHELPVSMRVPAGQYAWVRLLGATQAWDVTGQAWRHP